MRYITIFLLFIAFSCSVLAQKKTVTKSTPEIPCNLTIQNAPKLRGFYLGQTIDEVARVFPSIKAQDANYYIEDPNDPQANYRVIVLGYDDFQKAGSPEDFNDVSIVWHFYKGILVSIFVTYTEYMPGNLRNFINQTAEKTNVPARSFRVTEKHKALAVCDGFTVELIEGSFSRVSWSPENSEIILEDVKRKAFFENDKKEYAAFKKAEQLRKKQEEIKRRTTLKP